LNVQHDFARQIKKALVHYGIDKQPLGIDVMELGMLRALEAEGILVVDGQQALLDAREIKTGDEIELLKMAAAMVDATYVDNPCPVRPGVRENELVAIAHDRLFRMGSERVECINSVSGQRGRPHSHTFSDRMIQPGDMIFLDIMHSYNGYRTCYYRTFICGEPNKHQIEAYETASKWISASIDMIKPGVTPDEVAAVWPDAHEFGTHRFIQQLPVCRQHICRYTECR
jgi:Xaa-Pro aminopeptidase